MWISECPGHEARRQVRLGTCHVSRGRSRIRPRAPVGCDVLAEELVPKEGEESPVFVGVGDFRLPRVLAWGERAVKQFGGAGDGLRLSRILAV